MLEFGYVYVGSFFEGVVYGGCLYELVGGF